MNKKKGFTLIELIAVLVILAIIALIVTPLVMNIVKKAKISSDKRSVEGYGKAVELAFTTSRLDGKRIKPDRYHSKADTNGKMIYDVEDNELYSVDYDGKDVYCDVIDRNEDGSIYLKDCYVNGKAVDYTYGVSQTNVLMSVPSEFLDSSIWTTPAEFLSTGVNPAKIKNLNIVNSIDIPSGYNSSDCSEAQDKSVMCWWTQNGDYYDMYIGADGVVYAPKDATELFAGVGYDAMTTLDLGDYFDTSKTTNMTSMFSKTGYSNMTSFDLGSSFDSSNAVNMTAMFESFGKLKMPQLTLKNLDTSNVVNMSYMFSQTGFTSMTKLDLGDKFDTSKVKTMSWMFYNVGCEKLKSLDLGENFNTSNVEDMSNMFLQAGYSNLSNFNIGSKFDTSNVTNMSSMFRNFGNYELTVLDLGDKFDTSNVTNMEEMFSSLGQHKLTLLDLGDKFDTSNVTNIYRMFSGMAAYTTSIGSANISTKVYLGNFGVNRSKIENYSYAFDFGNSKSRIQLVQVANNDVLNWINGMSTSDVPSYIKNVLKVQS